MQNLFQPEAAGEVISRIDRLQPTIQHQWWKMDVAQMMAHCSATLDVASGRVFLPRMFIGRILGPFFRPQFTNEKPFSKNGPTDKSFVIADKRDFVREKEHLKTRVSGSFPRAGNRNVRSIPTRSSVRSHPKSGLQGCTNTSIITCANSGCDRGFCCR